MRSPRRVKVLDWPRYSAGHREWFQPDGLHLTFSGARAYTRLMRKLIPLAHQLPLSHVDVSVEVDGGSGEARIEAEAATVAGTGVEMEALTACSVAALTLYDMVKGIERGVVIDGLRLLEKSGGKHDWRAE